MTDATTGQGADGARHGEKTTGVGPAGRAHGTDGRPKSPQGEESAPPTERRGSGSPLVAGSTGHEAAAQGQGQGQESGTKTSTASAESKAGHGEGSHRGRLIPHDESDKLSLRLQHAVAGFVDEPRNAVEEADHVMEEVASRVTDALTRRRRTLRTSWQDGADKHGNAGDTEQLRLALRDYRELTDRLLHL
ncbi:hypothetical protein HLK59_42920 [Streptomyces sp. S3(2020)]|uniref:hypothetical protein n=1 Tax=Streptomyces sp. S3(2020) TaxID=2732044 RepID=UPI0014885095|nr:hypothetical protein [Streptomyces sp. S3(2020)]NNN36989.1 hypothetical protein [Streptomyces sp. S3(2020)]